MIRSAKVFFLVVSLAFTCLAQRTQAPAQAAEAPDTKAGAYYNFAMGRLYNELAQAEGNREYVSKAIQYYQEALKLDPSTGVIFEELTDLYVQTGRLADAVAQAEDLLKRNPDNLDARRMLARIYTQLARGTGQDAKVDETYLRKAVAEYQKIVAKAPKDAESWVTLGKLYRASNDSLSAEKAFNSAVQADPDNEDGLTALAMMYSELGDTTKAMEKLKVLADKNPSARTLTLLAQQYEQSSDYKSAAEVLRRAVAANPDDEALSRNLAIDLAESGQYDESIKTFEQLAADNPREATYPLQLSRLYLSQYASAKGKNDSAKSQAALTQSQDWLKKARAIEPTNLLVRDQQANLLEAQGKTDDAIAELKSALEEMPRRSRSSHEPSVRGGVLKHLGILYRNAKQYPQAVETFRQLASTDDEQLGGEALVQIVETYRLSNDLAAAQREADAAFKKYPNNPMVLEEHAGLLADAGKVDEAASEVRSLLKNGPGDREVQMELAQIYEKGKRWSDMAKALNEAEQLSTGDREKEAVQFMRGAMFERQKKYDASEAAFRKVLDANPNNAGALNYLGYMLADRGVRLDEALDLVKKALELEPDNGAYLDSLGWVYFRQGKLSEAEGLLQRALDKMQDPTVHDHLGDVYLKLGKTKEAIAQWQASLREFQKATQADRDTEEMARVNQKLDDAQSRLAKETRQK